MARISNPKALKPVLKGLAALERKHGADLMLAAVNKWQKFRTERRRIERSRRELRRELQEVEQRAAKIGA